MNEHNYTTTTVSAMQVGLDNCADVAAWCKGEVRMIDSWGAVTSYVVVPLDDTHTQIFKAFIGDWVALDEVGTNFVVYTKEEYTDILAKRRFNKVKRFVGEAMNAQDTETYQKFASMPRTDQDMSLVAEEITRQIVALFEKQ